MNKLKMLFGLLLSLGFLAAPAMAGDFDGSKTLMCASMDVVECLPGGECNRVAPEDIEAPEFLWIDFKDKEIRTARSGKEQPRTAIERMETVDDKLIIQGAEDGREEIRDGLGWTMAIHETSGKMVLTASGTNVGFVIFGGCVVPPEK